MRGVRDHRKENAGFHLGCREGARTRRESWRTRFQFRFSNPAAQNVFHDPGRRSGRPRRSDLPAESIRTNHLATCKSELELRSVTPNQQVNLWHADPASCGSTFVKYGELFACAYQSGAASSFFKS